MKQFISAMLLALLMGMPIQAALATDETDTSQDQNQEMQLPDDEAADSADSSDNTSDSMDEQGGEADQPMDGDSYDPQADSQASE